MQKIAFFDIEVTSSYTSIADIGCILSDDSIFHKNNATQFASFVEGTDFLIGHNIFAHDLPFVQKALGKPGWGNDNAIDTLLLSPLLFPQKPYHKLIKDDKLQTDEINNPVNDSIKAKNLFFDEVAAFKQLDPEFREILSALLVTQNGFTNFFRYLKYTPHISSEELESKIRNRYDRVICSNAKIDSYIQNDPIALAYSLALIDCHDRHSITPPWVLRNYPQVEHLLFLLRNNPCAGGCSYCNMSLNPVSALKNFFGYDGYRMYDDQPLQEEAVKSAISGKSLLAIFPTGGGKSITFQVPALISGQTAKALTIVISPLQSLMKDQVDNLEKKGIVEAVTINGLLDPIERSKAIERVSDGSVSILYISPESLRSITIEKLLLNRKIARFVIDEAHCFSSWGQDFRVDYLYIGDFIKNLSEKKKRKYPIPVSCFTATAKPNVIEDIKNYFKEKLDIDLETFQTGTSRKNLDYHVYHKEEEEEKYSQLRNIVERNNCPIIVYVSRTKKATKIAERLREDGFAALPFHGKMDIEEKSRNQDSFMNGETNIIVATSAFGMGVDKSDVGIVVHYDISDSLENYVQEAGRAGRDEQIRANCYILFNEQDLDQHFSMLNNSKISIKEINQVWKAIKDLTKFRTNVSNSALEIARKAGWDDGIAEIGTRVTTAIAALEEAGYLKRGQNMPRLFATSILSKNAQEAINKITASELFTDGQKINAARIIKKLFSSKSKRLSTEEAAESRVDYISDQLGIPREEVIRIIELLKEEKILAHTRDLTAFIKKSESANRSLTILENYKKQEEFLLSIMKEGEHFYNLKEIIELSLKSDIKNSSINSLKTILNFWSIKKWVKKQSFEKSKNHLAIDLKLEKNTFREKFDKRHLLARLITEFLHKKSTEVNKGENKEEQVLVEFSIEDLRSMLNATQGLFSFHPTIDDIEDTLFYLSRIESIKIEGGFMVIYNKITIDRIETNNKIKYKESDYEKLSRFYAQKVQQIHIIGEYAKKMISDYSAALQFVDDYFRLKYSSFITKYFPGNRQDEIKRTLTPEKFMKLFGSLSPAQLGIVNDSANQYIMVAAGPGSGKTTLLVHKLASLLLAEDVKHEQLLMLTFSRVAATEFKKRLIGLIGASAAYIEIKTFHSYSFDLLGRMGSLSEAENILERAVQKIRSGEVDSSRITKTVLVVDEAQDMSAMEYELVKCLMEENEDMRVILVGDDDQNIFEFRKSDARYMKMLVTERNAQKYEMTENFRSSTTIVSLANKWVSTLQNRLKETSGIAKKPDPGKVEITEYSSQQLVRALSIKIKSRKTEGTTCVLTHTNADAFLITGLLLKTGVKAKLIQSNDHFNLSNLYELRQFTDIISRQQDSPIVSNEEWEKAKTELKPIIATSNNKELVYLVITDFETTNPARKYRSDWNTYLAESKMEDFLKAENDTIYISTIHKAKGKEFDNVFLLLKKNTPATEEEKRIIYVGITRARCYLSIHYNGNYLQPYTDDQIDYYHDTEKYSEPDQISIWLTHKNVQLGYFAYVQHKIRTLSSGASLVVLNDGLGTPNGQQIVRFSKAFSAELAERARLGFRVTDARINYILFWTDKDTQKEHKIILPQLTLSK